MIFRTTPITISYPRVIRDKTALASLLPDATNACRSLPKQQVNIYQVAIEKPLSLVSPSLKPPTTLWLRDLASEYHNIAKRILYAKII